MNVLYFATLRDVTKKRGEEWHQPAPTLGVLMRDLIARYGSGFEKWVSASRPSFRRLLAIKW